MGSGVPALTTQMMFIPTSDRSLLLGRPATTHMRRLVLVALLCPVTARADVDPRGNFTTRVPFEVPSFYGITPSIGLDYTGGPTGDAGAGWHLGAGSVITRTSATRGTPRFDAGDRFWLD